MLTPLGFRTVGGHRCDGGFPPRMSATIILWLSPFLATALASVVEGRLGRDRCCPYSSRKSVYGQACLARAIYRLAFARSAAGGCVDTPWAARRWFTGRPARELGADGRMNKSPIRRGRAI